MKCNTRKTGKYQMQTTNRSGFFLISAAALLIIAGIFIFVRKEETPSADTDVPLEIVSTDGTEQSVPDYDALLNVYRTAITDHWTEEQCRENGISYRFQYNGYAKEPAAYAMLDMDGNGVEELAIGHGMPHCFYVWDLYTFDEHSQPVLLHSDKNNGENCHIYQDGIIGVEYTGKTEGYFYYYGLQETRLVRADLLTYKEDVWHDTVTNEQIASEKANDILNKYDMIDVEPIYLMEDTDSPPTDFEMLEVFQIILEKYRTAVAEKWDYSQCMEAEICPLISVYTDAPDAFGYTLIDLDGDGTEELIITDGNVLLDVYKRFPTGTEKIITGWERNVYYLCEDNMIFNRGSNGAASTVYFIYRITEEGLTQTESIVFDAMTNPDNPWSYQEEKGTSVVVSEAEAMEILDSYIPLAIDYTPINVE